MAARLKDKDKEHTTHGKELQDPKQEVARLRADAEKHRPEAQEDIVRRKSGLTTRDEEVIKQRTELKRRTTELDALQRVENRPAAAKSRTDSFRKCKVGSSRRLAQKFGATCTAKEELMKMATSSWGKLATRSGEILTRKGSWCILKFDFKALPRNKRNVVDAEVLASQDCEMKAADRFDAFLFHCECFVHWYSRVHARCRLACSWESYRKVLDTSLMCDTSSVRQMIHTPCGTSLNSTSIFTCSCLRHTTADSAWMPHPYLHESDPPASPNGCYCSVVHS